MSASTDTIGDFLTGLRNASQATKPTISVQWSRLREGVARILLESGYIVGFRKAERDGLPVLEVTLKYVAGVPSITSIERVSTWTARLRRLRLRAQGHRRHGRLHPHHLAWRHDRCGGPSPEGRRRASR